MSEKEEMQKKFYEYSMYKNQIEALAQELGALNATMNNLNIAKLTLDNVKKENKESEILVPIGGNSFLIGKIKDPENVLIGVGSDIIVKKPITEAKSVISEQLDQLNEAKQNMEKQIIELNDKMGKLEPEVQKLAQELQEKGQKKE